MESIPVGEEDLIARSPRPSSRSLDACLQGLSIHFFRTGWHTGEDRLFQGFLRNDPGDGREGSQGHDVGHPFQYESCKDFPLLCSKSSVAQKSGEDGLIEIHSSNPFPGGFVPSRKDAILSRLSSFETDRRNWSLSMWDAV